jgi:hypothetical protein
MNTFVILFGKIPRNTDSHYFAILRHDQTQLETYRGYGRAFSTAINFGLRVLGDAVDSSRTGVLRLFRRHAYGVGIFNFLRRELIP